MEVSFFPERLDCPPSKMVFVTSMISWEVINLSLLLASTIVWEELGFNWLWVIFFRECGKDVINVIRVYLSGRQRLESDGQVFWSLIVTGDFFPINSFVGWEAVFLEKLVWDKLKPLNGQSPRSWKMSMMWRFLYILFLHFLVIAIPVFPVNPGVFLGKKMCTCFPFTYYRKLIWIISHYCRYCFISLQLTQLEILMFNWYIGNSWIKY